MYLSPDLYYVTSVFIGILMVVTVYNFWRSSTGFVSTERLLILVSMILFALALVIEGWQRITGRPGG